MSHAKITVGGALEDEASRRFVDAWRRAERGEAFRERHLAFESWDALPRLLTRRRMELLGYVRRHEVKSVRALAKALRRDYSNVHADVQALTAAGLLDIAEGVRPSTTRSKPGSRSKNLAQRPFPSAHRGPYAAVAANAGRNHLYQSFESRTVWTRLLQFGTLIAQSQLLFVPRQVG